MTTTDWRQSTWGKLVSVILTFALAFSFLSLPAYADEVEDATDAAASVDASAAPSDAQDADEGSEDATAPTQQPVESTHPVAAQASVAEEAEAVDDAPNMQLTEEINLEYVGYAYVGNVIVKVTAPAGVVEIGTQVSATAVTDEAVIDAVDEVMASQNKEMVDSVAIDVELVNADGAVVQPKGNVNVSFFDAAIEGDEVAVYHVSDDARQVQKVPTLQADSNVQSFNVNHFSIYVVGSVAAPQFVTYRFFVPSATDSSVYPPFDEPSYTQRVQKGDTLVPVPTPSYPGKTLAGWSTVQNPFNFNDLVSSVELFSTVGDLNENQTIVDYYATYAEAVNVSFAASAEDEAPIIYVATGFRGDSISTSAASNQVALADNQGVAGWAETPTGANKAAAGNYQIESDKDVTLYPIIETGTLVEFDLGTTDVSATYVEPRFVPAGKSYYQVYGEELPYVNRTGYNFVGWALDGEGELSAVLDNAQDSNVTLTAQWRPGYTTVEVVAFAETSESAFDAVDDEKTYERLVPINPTNYSSSSFETGTIIDVETMATSLLLAYSYESQNYTVNTERSTKNAYVQADGNTQVNIYLDRARKTVKLYTGYTDSTEGQKVFGGDAYKTIKYVYGQNVSDQIPTYINGTQYKWMRPTGTNGNYVVDAWSSVADPKSINSYPLTDPESSTVVLCGLPIERTTGTIYYYKQDTTTGVYNYDHQAPIFDGVTFGTFQGLGAITLTGVSYTAADVDFTAQTAAGEGITELTPFDWYVDPNAPITHEGNVYVLYYDMNDMVLSGTDKQLAFIIPNGSQYGQTTHGMYYVAPGTPLTSYASVLNAPEMRDGYVFKGWYEDPTYAETNKTYELSTAVMPDHALTLFGFYVPQTPTVSFATDAVNVTNADNYGTSSFETSFGQRIKATQLPAVKAGDTVVSNGAADYEAITIPGNCSWYGWCVAENDGFVKFDFSTPIEKSVTLVPYCTVSDTAYKVQYYVNGTQVKEDPATYEALATAPVLPFDGDQADFVCWTVKKDDRTYNYYPGGTTDQMGTLQTGNVVKMEASFQEQLPQVGIVYHSQGTTTYETAAVDNNSEVKILDYMFDDNKSAAKQFVGWTADPAANVVDFEVGQDVVLTKEEARVVDTDDGLVIACNDLYPVFGYTIAYELNGGAYYETDAEGFMTEIFPNPSSYTQVTESITLQNPTKPGYDFIGWTGSNGTEYQTKVVIQPGTTGNLTYVANWEVKGGFYYSIRYVHSEDNNKDVIPPITSDDLGTNFGPYNFGTEVTLPDYYLDNDNVVIPGYHYNAPASTLTIGEYDNSFRFICIPETYSISYELNGGSLPQSDFTGSMGDMGDGGMMGTPVEQHPANPEFYSIASTPEELTLVNPTRPGSVFQGWRISKYTDTLNDDGIVVRQLADVTWPYDPLAVVINNEAQNLANLMIEADWKEQADATITYKAAGPGTVELLSGGDEGLSIEEKVKPFSGKPVGAVAFADSNSRFVGWYLGDVNAEMAAGQTSLTEWTDHPMELTAETVDRYGRVVDGAFGDITFTAVFEQSEYGNTYQVTYRIQSIDGTPTGSIGLTDAGDNPEYGTQLTDPGINSNGTDGINSYTAFPAPAFTGGFDGWYANGTKVSDQAVLDVDTIKAHIRSYKRGNDTVYTDTVFEARFFEGAPFEMQFFGSEGGSPSSSILSVSPFSGVDNSGAFQVNAVPDTGYDAVGWYTDPSFASDSQVSDFGMLYLMAEYVDDPAHGIYASPLFKQTGPYYAKFRPDYDNSFQVAFKANGNGSWGSVAMGNDTEDDDFYQFVSSRHYHYMNGQDVTGATAKAAPGYKFVGWYLVDELVSTSSHISAISIADKLQKEIYVDPNFGFTTERYNDLLFTARFDEADPVVIEFQVDNADFGTLKKGDQTGSYLTDSVKPVTGTPAEITAVPAVGYKVDGWYDAKGKKVSDEAAFRPERPAGDPGIYEAAVYTVRFEVDKGQEYTITYTAVPGDGGEVAVEDTSKFASNVYESYWVLNSSEVKGAKVRVSAGYKFVGWYAGETLITEDATLSGEMAAANLNRNGNACANTTFIAKFDEATDTAAKYVIYFVDGDGAALEDADEGMVALKVPTKFTARQIDGYELTNDAEQWITAEDPEKTYELTFTYTKRTDLSYKVECLDESGTILQSFTEGGQTFQATFDVDAPEIEGYVAPKAQTITIGIEDNVITFYYTIRTDLSYTVKYLERVDGAEKEVASVKTVDGLTFDAEITEEAIDIDGYNKIAPSSATITIGVEDNVITFYYTKKNDLSYTVNYIDKNTNKPLATAKAESGLTFDAEITEEAIDIDGYDKVDPASATIKISTDAEKNVIAFYYTIRTDLSYTVKCVDEDGAALVDITTVEGQTFNSVVIVRPEEIAGYVAPEVQYVTITTGDNTVTLVYKKRTDLSYSVNYVDSEDHTIQEPQTVSGQTYLAEVEVSAPDIAGYVTPEAKTIVIHTEGNAVTFEYAPRSDLSYTVNYLERVGQDGNETRELAAPKTVDKQVFKTTVTEKAIDIAGYDPSNPAMVTITIGLTENVIDFYYTKKNALSYTVNYLEQGTDSEIAPAKMVGSQTYQNSVTEGAIDIVGYNKVAPTDVTITIGVEDNVITFYYTKKNDLSYTVNYLEQTDDGVEAIAQAKVVTNQLFGAEITESAAAVPGYVGPMEAATITIGVEDNVIDFYYTKRTDLSYTVNYLEQGTDKVLYPAETYEGKEFKAVAVESHKPIYGYNVIGASTQTITIGVEDNVITFYYAPITDLSYTVHYIEEGTQIVLADAKVVGGQTYGALVTEEPLDIPGYTAPDGAQSIFVEAVDELNVIYFQYTKSNVLSYTVNYYRVGTTTSVADQKVVSNRTLQETYTEIAPEVAGYTVDAESKDITMAAADNVINFYYTPVSDLIYTIKCVDASGAIADDRTVANQVYGEDVEVKAPTLNGYVAPEAQTITIGLDRNEVTFVYAPREDMAYTVNYVDANGNAIANTTPVKGIAVFKESITVEAIAIDGYNVDASSKSVVIGLDDGSFVEDTQIYFVYTPREDCSYEVQYTMPDGSLKTVHIDGQVFGAQVTVTPEAIDGYAVTPTSARIIIGLEPQTVKFAYANRTDLGYTVNYLETGTNNELRPTKQVVDQTFGTEINFGTEVQGINIEGYEFDYAVPESFEVGTEARGNVMNLYYKLRSDLSLTINYLNKETNEVVAPETVVSGLVFGTTVEATEYEKDILGYNFDSFDRDSITIDVAQNAINAFYTPRTDISYTVRYVVEGTDILVKDADTISNKKFGETVTVSAATVPGYVLVGGSTQTMTLGLDNTITFEYKKATGLTYTVQYIYLGTVVASQIIAGEGEEGFVYGDVVTVEASLPTGYNLAVDEEASKDVTIGLESDENVVKFNVTPVRGLTYTVNYLDISGATIPNLPYKKVYDQAFGTTVTEIAPETIGYTRPEQTSRTITLGLNDEDNVITFYYTKMTNLSYTVKYVVQGTGEVLGSKTVENKGYDDVIVENAQPFMGYTPTVTSKNVTVVFDMEDIVFYYAPRTDISYTVQYMVEKGEGFSLIAPDKVVTTGVMASTVTETAKIIPGYTLKSDDQQTIKLEASDNVVRFIYTANADIEYTVSYLELGTNKAVADELTVSGKTMATPVTAQALDLMDQGYKLSENEADTKTLMLAATGNQITFLYVPRADLSYTIEYQDTNGNPIHESTEMVGQTFGKTVVVHPIDINGYNTPVDKAITIAVENEPVVFTYEPQVVTGDQSYTVRHVYDTGEAVTEPETFDGFSVGDEVTANALMIRGYAADSETKSLTLVEGTNEIVFTYSPRFDNVVRGYNGTYNGMTQTVYIGGTILDSDQIRYTVNGVNVNNAFTNAGTYIVSVTITRGGQSKLYGCAMAIAKAPLVITTNTAAKTFDGTPLTAGGSITGLVNNETVTFNITGSQTWWGSSKNTYELIWNGTAQPYNYRLAAEGIGTLTVRLLPIDPIETPTDPIETPIDQPGFDGEAPDLTPAEGDGTVSGADVIRAQSANGNGADANTQAQVTVPIDQIGDDEAPLAGLPGGELMPGANGIDFGDLSGKATGIAVLTISGILLTALYTLFAVGRRKRFMKGRSDDLM